MAKEFKIPIKCKKEDRYYNIVEILRMIYPLNKLRPRERQVYAALMEYYHKYSSLGEKERNRLIFDFETRSEIAEKIGVSKDVIYNIMKDLKKKGVIGKSSMKKDYIVSKYNKITFEFIDQD